MTRSLGQKLPPTIDLLNWFLSYLDVINACRACLEQAVES